MTSDGSMAIGKAEEGDETEPVRPPYGAPDNEVPATLAVDAVLGSTDDVVIYLAAMSVYSSGVRFTLEVRARPGWSAPSGGQAWEAVHGHSRDGDRLLLGVEYADGRSGSNLEGPFASGAITLRSGSSSGGSRSASVDWYLAPLPPPGDVRLYCAWPGAGIEETVAVLDGGLLREAASRVRELWPWEPERYEEAGRPLPPVLPAGGWFAAHSKPVTEPTD